MEGTLDMSDTKQYDGVSALGDHEVPDDLPGADTQTVSTTIERRGDFANTPGPLGGRTRMTLEPYAVDPSTGAEPEGDLGPLDDTARDELAEHGAENEKRNSVTSWDQTGESDLPTAGPQPRAEE
jgi:hypothetical protein